MDDDRINTISLRGQLVCPESGILQDGRGEEAFPPSCPQPLLPPAWDFGWRRRSLNIRGENVYSPPESCPSKASPIGKRDYSTLVSHTPAAERAESIFWPAGDQGKQPRTCPVNWNRLSLPIGRPRTVPCFL